MPECELCERTVAKTTRHHLVPKNRKGSPTVDLCQPCHDQAHAVFTHHELKQHYDTLEKLESAPEIEKFVRWVRKTDPTRVKTRDAERVRDWRS
ncbi:HNH endonuclease [Natronobeatus ordinarius]|uniref:HNH endonuclease n=1 Tax=Natronobeatus ordinarius TaxID=2963433 RepID=UPI0020CEEDBA|nr:HNH endonuclease [Natronobeatus ordinarius]